MNFAQFITVIAFKAIFKGGTLKLATVLEWVRDNSRLDDFERGYAGNQLSDAYQNSFAEIRRERISGLERVTASIYFDARQRAAVTKVWNVKRLDSKMESFFGNNLRARIDV